MQISLIVFILISTVSICHSEMFSAIEALEKLFNEEAKVLESFQAAKLIDDYSKEKLNKWIEENEKARKNFTEYIGNPLNAFLLIKRMAVDYVDIQDRLGIKIEYFKPDESDLTGAVEGLLRLQPFYKQKSSDFAEGVIDGVKTRKALTAHDLYVIGSEARKIPNHEYFAKEYFHLAWQKLNEGENDDDVNSLVLLLETVEVLEKIFDYKNALEVMNFITKHFNTLETFIKMRDELSKLYKEFGNTKFINKSPFVDNFIKKGYYTLENELLYYAQNCRGEVEKTAKEKSKLHCRYVSNSHFSKLARFKVEEANLDPYIVVFFDVLSDSEIDLLKNITRPNIDRAKVASNAPKTNVLNQSRVAQIAWFFDTDHEIVRRISQRIEDMTGLTMETAARLQVQNYGIAGHYIPHWDHQPKNIPGFTVKKPGLGNRIATTLLYMSDVKKGGETVFPYVQVKVPARKGTAAFWYNLRSSGEDNGFTRHAACPVLLGNKWVANKWIYEAGQEFRRKCEPNDSAETVEHAVFAEFL